jgi:hypothetical protein
MDCRAKSAAADLARNDVLFLWVRFMQAAQMWRA